MPINILIVLSSFSFREILIPVAILGGIALVMGLLIALISRLFSVKTDELQVEVMSALPQANCGACGFTGCEGYAKWLASGGQDMGKCPVGGPSLPITLGKILGVEAQASQPPVAHVMCKGTNENTSKRYEYTGTKTCASAHAVFSGPNSCTYGCIGFGDCVEACQFDAIDIVGGIAVINELKCKSCEKCVPACPKKLIFMIPKNHKTYKVECRNHWPGGETRKHCKVGCIACQRCVKVCPTLAIHMDNNLAVIDPEKCINCGKCFEVCPTKSISTPENIYMHL
ncbi:MAG: RnfABCDGE type electron transport complex subunit B [Eubacteriales bacterium]|nr:RnfABCDGE type electron transport complex subunit B [Eubacteriales bacterium]